MECGNCKFCCWSFNAKDIPDPILGLSLKPAREHCIYECKLGCSIHGLPQYPQPCSDFKCPYLQGKYIHRPDNFQVVLEEMNIEVGSFIPAIPPHIPVKMAESLIRENRSIPAYILVGNEWVRVILSLDRKDAKTWIVNEKSVGLWQNLFRTYGESIDSTVEPGTLMVA